MRGRPFEPGNKMGRGRPPGSRNKRTVFAAAMEENGLAMIRYCQMQALKGDSAALRLCMERLLPACKASAPRFRLPPVRSGGDSAKALEALLQAVSRGQLSAQEGAAIATILESQGRALDTEEIYKRLDAREQGQASAAAADEPGTSRVAQNGNEVEETTWLEPHNDTPTPNTAA